MTFFCQTPTTKLPPKAGVRVQTLLSQLLRKRSSLIRVWRLTDRWTRNGFISYLINDVLWRTIQPEGFSALFLWSPTPRGLSLLFISLHLFTNTGYLIKDPNYLRCLWLALELCRCQISKEALTQPISVNKRGDLTHLSPVWRGLGSVPEKHIVPLIFVFKWRGRAFHSPPSPERHGINEAQCEFDSLCTCL